MPRGVVDGVRAFHRDTPRLLVHVFAVAELRLDDVDLFHVLESRGPLTGLETYDAADDLGQPLQHDEDAGHGNHRLERIDRRARGGGPGGLAGPPRGGGVVVTRGDEGQGARGGETQGRTGEHPAEIPSPAKTPSPLLLCKK